MSRHEGVGGLRGPVRPGEDAGIGHVLRHGRDLLRGAALRWTLALIFVLWLAGEASNGLVQWALPVLREALAITAPDFAVLQLGVIDDERGTLLAAVVRPARSIILGGRAILPDPQATMVVTATLGSIVLPLWTGLLLVLAWPGPLGETLLRLPTLAPMLALLLAVDTPLALAAWMWLAQLRQHDPGGLSVLVAWNTFLGGGGRVLLGGLAGAGAVMLARWLAMAATRAEPCLGSPGA